MPIFIKVIFSCRGICKTCQSQLRHVYLSTKEFSQLSKTFLEKVLLRNDTFLKSSPTEVVKFEHFLQQYQPFDCVIDGLNVAYSTGAKSHMVYANIVRYKLLKILKAERFNIFLYL